MVSGTHKFDRGLSRLLHTELHWLDVPGRVVYKLSVMMFNCLHSQAPQYLVELCQPVAGVASRQHHRSATRQLLVVCVTSSAPMVDGLSVWMVRRTAGLLAESDNWREQFQAMSEDVSVRNVVRCIQRIRGFTTMRYINRLFTYLLLRTAPPVWCISF